MSTESYFLTETFRRFNSANISYCVLRNYESLPISTNGSDVDILISKQHFEKAHSIMHLVASLCGGKSIAGYDSPRARFTAYFGFTKGAFWGVRIDAYEYAGGKNCTILPFDHMHHRSSEHNSLRVANQNDSAILTFLKDLIGTNQDRRNKQIPAVAAFRAEALIYTPILIQQFGRSVFASTIFPLLTGTALVSRTAGSLLLRAHFCKRLRANPIFTMCGAILTLCYKLRRLLNPPGIVLAVLGTDGAGKSTIIEAIAKPLESALHTKILYTHLRPNLLPSLAGLFGRHEPSGPVTEPHKSIPSGFVGSLIRLLYYSIDYIFGYWLKVFPAIAKRTQLFIFDRYFYDYCYDQRRSRISLPSWIIGLFSHFIPRPNLILCLGAEPNVIHARKPELSIEEVRRQIKELRSFCAKTSNAVWIDTGQPIEKSVNDALRAITENMAERYAKA